VAALSKTRAPIRGVGISGFVLTGNAQSPCAHLQLRCGAPPG